MNRQEILEALKNDNYYRNLSDKDFFDANNLDNLAKYLEHNFAKTDESKKVILDMLSHKKHNPSDLYNYRITQEELFNLNKKYYDNTYLYHGLNAYTTNLTDKSLDISEKIENNLHNIINNKDIELATSSTHMIGDIGIKGKGNSLFAQPWDMYSVVNKETGKRSKPREKAIITEDDIFGIIEKYHKNPKRIKPWEKHDEVITKNFEIESLWVKEDFYNNNQDFVLKLLKDNKIQNLDIVHSNSFEQYHNVDIERINVNNINLEDKKITPQEAFDKYGPNDDRFYTSQGLDPKEQKEAINKLNSKRKPPEPLPDYSADNARLDKMLAEDKAYIESLEKQRKRPNYKPVKGPKLKKTIKQDNNLEKATNEVFNNFTENINNTPKPKVNNTPKPKVNNTPKQSKNIVKPVKSSSKMTTKSLGGSGKVAIGLIVAGVTGLAIGKALSSDDDNKDKKQDKQIAKQKNISYNNQYIDNQYDIDNQYAMQMARDISSYRYGKHITGFVNF